MYFLGYCCTFNAIAARSKTSEEKNEGKVYKEENQYTFLQKAVWDFHDQFRLRNNRNEEEGDEIYTTGKIR